MEKVFLVVLFDKFPLFAETEENKESPPIIKSFVDVVVTNCIEDAHVVACKHTGIERDLDTNNLVYDTFTATVEVNMYNTRKESEFYQVFFADKHNQHPVKVPGKLKRIMDRVPSLFKRKSE